MCVRKVLVFLLSLSIGCQALAVEGEAGGGKELALLPVVNSAAYDATVDALKVDAPVLGIVLAVTGSLFTKKGLTACVIRPIGAAMGYSFRKADRRYLTASGANTTSTTRLVVRGAIGGGVKYFPKYLLALRYGTRYANFFRPSAIILQGSINNVCYELVADYLAEVCSNPSASTQARCAGVIMAIEGGEVLVEGLIQGAAAAIVAGGVGTLGAIGVAKVLAASVGSALVGAGGGVAVGFLVYTLATNPNVHAMAVAGLDTVLLFSKTAVNIAYAQFPTAGTDTTEGLQLIPSLDPETASEDDEEL
ncbi:MAG: hypothetical protein KA436_09240 [Oligoflexales bacterium]|nr:hypothetical protein [Oligoflexales bacterium]